MLAILLCVWGNDRLSAASQKLTAMPLGEAGRGSQTELDYILFKLLPRWFWVVPRLCFVDRPINSI